MADAQDSDSEISFNYNANHSGGGDENDYEENCDVGGERNQKYRPVPVKPDPYTGEEDWDQYISYFEDCAELAQWSEKEKLLQLATSLKQQARLHYSSLPLQERRTYGILKTRLEQRFGSKRQAARWLSKIQTRTRGKNESVAAFGDDILLYAQRAYASLGPDAQEVLALEHFYKSFSPEMRCRLMDKGCLTIREAVEIVERYEDVLGRANTSVTMSNVRNLTKISRESGNDQAVETASHMEEMRIAIKRLEQRLDNLESGARKGDSKGSCFSCGSRDHYFRQCPRKNNSRVRDSSYQENYRLSPQ